MKMRTQLGTILIAVVALVVGAAAGWFAAGARGKNKCENVEVCKYGNMKTANDGSAGTTKGGARSMNAPKEKVEPRRTAKVNAEKRREQEAVKPVEEPAQEPVEIVKQIDTDDVTLDTAEVLTVGQGMNDSVDVIENAIFSDSSLGEDSVTEVEEPHDIFSTSDVKPVGVVNTAEPEAEVESNGFVPEPAAVEQDFQRNVPVDIISEKDFEQDEPVVKPLSKSPRFAKAMKLKRIITKKNTGEN